MPAFRNSPFAVVLVLNLRKDEMRRNAEDTTLVYSPTTCGEPPPSVAGFYVTAKQTQARIAVRLPARMTKNRLGVRPYSPSPETTWACERDATKDTPPITFPSSTGTKKCPRYQPQLSAPDATKKNILFEPATI